MGVDPLVKLQRRSLSKALAGTDSSAKPKRGLSAKKQKKEAVKLRLGLKLPENRENISTNTKALQLTGVGEAGWSSPVCTQPTTHRHHKAAHKANQAKTPQDDR